MLNQMTGIKKIKTIS